ncbi:MAG: branched-chain amino acid ABC transporter permease [Deltaproteobacteria bacterium]|nr:branched-chain amino acid ABC transporter permease [Deltaproteobacteria bacterium]MBT4644437.1 branched-chain amino acid ABC transporter permease [Deltaproteobacteria bacterium]
MLRKKVYGLWIFGGLSLAILPLFLDTGIIRILVFANLYAILAMSWDIFSGHTGYISFGHSFLAGTAAYTSSLLNYHLGLPLFVSMPLAIIATLVLGMLLFFPALRLRGSYFTLITLLLSVVAVQFVKIFSQYTGGDRGLTPISTIASGAIANFYVTLAFMLIIALGLWYVSTSHLGFVLKAIAQAEDTVSDAGLDTTKFKFFAFLLSAFTAGIGGCLWVHYLGSVTPAVLSVDLSVFILIAAIIGGMGTIIGPILGGYVMVFLLEYLRPYVPSSGRMLIFGILGMMVLLYFSEGLGVKLRAQIQISSRWIKTRKKNYG